MRREELYLKDIIEAADSIAEFIDAEDAMSFSENDLVQSAVLQKLTIIGEAASRLSKAFQSRYSDVAWADIIGFRNIVVHAYFSINWDIVWVTATKDVPDLRNQIENVIQLEL